MLNKQGILIFACGHPNYGRLAYNLAATIRAIEAEIPIAVVYTDGSLNHLGPTQRGLFSHFIQLPEGAPIGCGCKLLAYELSPFEETLLLDADMLWSPRANPYSLMHELSESNFTGITEGYFDFTDKEQHDVNKNYFFWADCNEIKTKYKIQSERIYQWRSEVLYFKKSKTAKQLFATAKKIFKNPGLTTMLKYAGGVADELALNIAAAIHDVHPHVYKWKPSFWYMINGGNIPELSYLYSNYSLISFGSNTSTGSAKDLYRRICKAACNKIGHQHVFPLVSKNEWLPQRKKN